MAGFLVVQRFDDLGKCEIYKHARYIAETVSNDPKSWMKHALVLWLLFIDINTYEEL